MKKIMIGVVTMGLLLISVPVTAQTDESQPGVFMGDNPVLAEGETVKGDYFTSGDVVQISGTVDGDLYASGGRIEIDGTVTGDVIAAGGQLSISGLIGQDVRAAAGDVVVSGRIGKNLTVAGGAIDLARKGSIQGSVLAFAGELNVASSVGGDLKAGAGNVTVGNLVNGDIEVSAENLQLTNQAKVIGDVNYMSGLEANVDRNAAVNGEIRRIALPASIDFESGINWMGLAISLISIFIIGWLVVSFMPNFTRNTLEVLSKRPLAAFLWGLVVLVMAPIAALLLMISLIGLPMGLILLAVYLISLYAVKIFVAVWVGDEILKAFKKNGKLVWSLLIGLAIYFALTAISAISFFMSLVVTTLGLGMTLIARKDLMVKLRKKNLV